MNKRYIYNKKGNYYNNLKIKNISKLEALILGNRDIIDPQKVKMFINPKIDDLYDPFLLNDMKEAVNLIISILKNNGKIRIFGDYDQDGITSIMTLIDGLLYFTDNISYDIADRFEDGYGISEKMVKKAIDDKVSLVITCDIGITAFDEIKKLRDSGINVILTDHHQVKKEEENEWVNQILPDANCVINPHRLDSNYPFSELCGAGVSFKLMQALFLKTNSDLEYLYSLLEYVAIGTVGDVVDLVDENRILVIEGLKRLNNTDKIAIKALLEQNGWNKKIDSYTLGFILSPLLNSTGRLSSAKEAVSLLMEEDID
ncbi:MAG: DHH family phosphoesterase, partial [Peptoniphilaceae bacterium]|nr:DHH family phosphoesterase [Peptoniphilaceae bacterium]